MLGRTRGSLLCSDEDCTEQLMVVMYWQRFARQLESQCSSETVLAAQFHTQQDGGICIVTAGKSTSGNFLPNRSALQCTLIPFCVVK